MSDPFWFDNISILFDKDRMSELFPTNEMTTNEKMNAIARLAIFAGVIISLYKNDTSFFIYTAIVLGYTLFVHFNHTQQESFGNYNDNIYENVIDPNKMSPTPENPFMNVLMTDYIDNPERKPANIVAGKEASEIVTDYFNTGLYRDVSDIWGKSNSQRQFYTMPNTEIPSNQDKFARWLYRSNTTCKEDSNYCNRYEDLRYNKHIFPDPEHNPQKK